MREASPTHLVLIPSYNTGQRVLRTVREARRHWNPVWVVVDGSTDGTAEALAALARDDAGLRVLVLPRNRGKGAAVLHGIREAASRGFTHALTMDADGQHPAASIPAFMTASAARPGAMVLGSPIFGPDAPRVRVQGRRISNGLARAETLGGGIDDVLCGFRVYPMAPLASVMAGTRWMRRFDFDAEAAVRLRWRGVVPVNLPVAVAYPTAEEGGVSHFNYVRDNALLTWMHLRLLAGAVVRLPALLPPLLRRRRGLGRASP